MFGVYGSWDEPPGVGAVVVRLADALRHSHVVYIGSMTAHLR